MPEKVDPPDRVAGQIAGRQHGVISIRQLRAAGLGDEAVRIRVAGGRLHRLHRGVYAVGHRPVSRRGFWMAAVLACGNGAILSHRSAAELWGLLRPQSGVIEVSTPRRSGRARREGIRLHRCSSLVAAMVTRRHDIPVTAPARTISDLRGTISERLWRRAVRQAELAGHQLGPGVETDGTRSDLDLRRRGFAVRRFDERQLNEEPGLVAADLAAALRSAPGPHQGQGQGRKR